MKNFLLYISIFCLGLVCLISCNNEPLDYSKLYVSRMDLSGAKSLILVKEDATRAIEGEFISAGLYKIDAEGNMTAVAVFFTEDKNGNPGESTHTLTVKPHELYGVTKNYLIANGCRYFDKDGDEVMTLLYTTLLIRKSDGRIWSVFPKSEYRETDNGDLYCQYNGFIYKYNLDSSTPTLDQITKKEEFFGNRFNIQDNGVIWEATYPYQVNGGRFPNVNFYEYFPVGGIGQISIEWPFSGYQELWDDKLLELAYGGKYLDGAQFGLEEFSRIEMSLSGDVLSRINRMFIGNNSFDQKPLIILNPRMFTYKRPPLSEEENNKYQQFCHQFIMANFLEIGDTWGDVKFSDNPIILQQPPAEFVWRSYGNSDYGYENDGLIISRVFPTDDYVLVTCSGSGAKWLTLIDLKKHEWRWVRKLDKSSLAYSGSSFRFLNKIWFIDFTIEHFGCNWLDLNSFEEGFIPFDFTLPDFLQDSRDNQYNLGFEFDNSGILTSSWTSPMDGNPYYLKVDILSGHGEISMTEVEMKSHTIIPLN